MHGSDHSELVKQIPLFAALPDNETASARGAADVHSSRRIALLEGRRRRSSDSSEKVAVFKSMPAETSMYDYGPGGYFGEVPLLLGSGHCQPPRDSRRA
jgi:hypothetical protein